MALTDTERAIRLEGAMQALEVMLRPGAGQATATVAHAVVLGWMEQDGIPIITSTTRPSDTSRMLPNEPTHPRPYLTPGAATHPSISGLLLP